MKRASLVAIFVLASALPCAAEPDVQMDFEQDHTLFVPRTVKDSGWTSQLSAERPFRGKRSLRLTLPRGQDGGPFGNVMRAIDAKPYRGKRIRLEAAVRAEGGKAQLWIRVDRPRSQLGLFDNMRDRPVRSSTWKVVHIEGDVASDAEWLNFGLIAVGDEKGGGVSVGLDALSIRVLGAATGKGDTGRAAAGPGIVEARGSFVVVASSASRPNFLIPLPLSYREQAPLTWRISTEPDDRLAGFRVFEDRPGNFVAEVMLQPMKAGEQVEVSWTSLVLCAPRSLKDLPSTAPLPKVWPAEARPWLQSTWCVQANDPRIRSIARELKGSSTCVREIIKRTLIRCARIKGGAKGMVENLSAVQALTRQGSCTSNANLMAALLRANGIPTRILSGYPVWFGPLQTHYMVEAWVPNHGWYAIESSLLREGWAPHQQVQVSIVPTEYEGERAKQRLSAFGGVPYLSLTELPSSLELPYAFTGNVDGNLGCDHVATTWRVLDATAPAEAWTEALERAKTRWRAWLATNPTLEAGAVSTPTGVKTLRRVRHPDHIP